MPAAARGRFFFSTSFQIFRIFLRMIFVALASFGYFHHVVRQVEPPRLNHFQKR